MHPQFIVGDDGSRVAAAAVEWAADEALRRNVRLRIVGCYTEPEMPKDAGRATRADEASPISREVERRLAGVAARVGARRPGLPIDTCAVRGRSRFALADQAHGAEALVIGSSGTGDAPTYHLGSVARSLIGSTPCPVVLVPSYRRLPDRPHIAVGLDGSDESWAALDWAVEETDLLHARLSVVHVWGGVGSDSTTTDEARDIYRVDAALHLERAIDRARARSGANIEGVLLEAETETDVAAAVVAVVSTAELVVLGAHRSHGPGTDDTVSLANAVIAHATCPVVVVNAAS